MQGTFAKFIRAALGSSLLLLMVVPVPAWGEPDDNNGFFGRLFRLGGNSSGAASFPATPGPNRNARNARPPQNAEADAHAPHSSQPGDIGPGGTTRPPAIGALSGPMPTPTNGPISSEGPSTPDIPANDAQVPIKPRARYSNAVTTADPLVVRVALGRSNDGGQFGMFLQVFADGTVIDSEGVHKIGPAELRPLVEAIQSGEIGRIRGHCGAPSNDFIEHVQVVAFERRIGRLQAHSFSYAGNPQGCDNGIRALHAAMEAIQLKISKQQAGDPESAASAPAPSTGAPATDSSTPVEVETVITDPSADPVAPASRPALASPRPDAAPIPLTPVPR